MKPLRPGIGRLGEHLLDAGRSEIGVTADDIPDGWAKIRGQWVQLEREHSHWACRGCCIGGPHQNHHGGRCLDATVIGVYEEWETYRTVVPKQATDLKAMRERLAVRTARVVAHETTPPSTSGNLPNEAADL